MTPREVQILHLLTLAIELDVLGRSVLLSLNRHDVPALYVGSNRIKIKAERRNDQWLYTWGRNESRWMKVSHRAARSIAAMVPPR